LKTAAFLKGIKLGATSLKECLLTDLARVEELMQESLRSEIPFIEKLNDIVLEPRGKRLRPALLILAAGSPGSSPRATILASAVVEMIHTATLLHDDVVDGSLQRRGRPTLNAQGGDGSAILMGDYVYSRAITLLVEAELTQVLGLLATTVHRMSIGELLQLELHSRPVLDEAAYLRVIYEKTARLIEATCRSGAILGGRPQEEVEAGSDFGHKVGMAFQIVDDVLDYVSDPETLGKPVGSDLAEGKQTLPLLKTYAAASPATQTRLLELLSDVDGHREEIVGIVRDEGGVEAALAEARRYGEAARLALRQMPRGGIRSALDATVDFILERQF